MRSRLGQLPCSSPTSVARAAFVLAGAVAPCAAVRLRPPPLHGTRCCLSSSSFPLPQPATPPLPLPGNWPLNSPPLNHTSADHSPPRQPPPSSPSLYKAAPTTTPPNHAPQLSSPRVPHTPSATTEICSPLPLAHLTASPPKVSPLLGSPHRPFASRSSAQVTMPRSGC
jgi:hypothetical protein